MFVDEAARFVVVSAACPGGFVMRMIRLRRLCFALALVLLFSPAILAADPPPAKVELKLASYNELGSVIKQHQGKVIVVDFWADF